jgi:hypothetical protein
MPKQFILSFVFILLSSLSLNAAAIVDGVYGMVVQDPAALVKAMDTWNASADSDGDQTVTLYETIANGEDPSTHLIVGDYQDYAAFEKQAGRMRTSADFAQFIQDLSAVAKPAWESISVHLATYGKGWNEHNHVAAVSLRVENPRAYAQAFDELMKSKAGKNLKGATKLIGVRAGSGVSHIVVITGASFAEINEGLDAMYASEEFSNFVAKVRGDREVLGTAFYRVVKRWQH